MNQNKDDGATKVPETDDFNAPKVCMDRWTGHSGKWLAFPQSNEMECQRCGVRWTPAALLPKAAS